MSKNKIIEINFLISFLFSFIFDLKLILVQHKTIYIFFLSDNLLFFFNFCKKHTQFQFSQLLDLWGVDKMKSIDINYLLNSIYLNTRVVLKTKSNLLSSLHTVSNIYLSANWLEREIWDMFGVFFDNHPDLRRILTDYGFESFPLLKHFPISGFSEILYNFEEKRIVFVNIELTQEFRFFSFNFSWNKN